MSNNTVYVKNVGKKIAYKWAIEVLRRSYVLRTGINNADALIGIATDEDRWIGLYKSNHDAWTILMSDGLMHKSETFKSQLMALAGPCGWEENSCSFVGIIRGSQLLRNNWDWQCPAESGMPEISDESLLDIVQLEAPPDPAEELFKQLPEAIREAVYNILPTEGALPGCTSRGETLEEVADFCIQVAAEQAARREADRLWDAWLIANAPKPARRRPRRPEGSKQAPRRKK